MEENAEKLPMERIGYEGGTGPRFKLIVLEKEAKKPVRKYGGDPVTPLYGRQARELQEQERKAGFLTRLIQLSPDGPDRVVESDV